MVKKLKSNKAITLISLVITIVIMLILAGVTINLVIGNNSIFNKTQVAAQKQFDTQVKENIETALTSVEMENAKNNEETTIESIKDKLEAEDSNITISNYDADNNKISGVYSLDNNDKDFAILNKDGKNVVSFESEDITQVPIETDKEFAYTGDAQEFTIKKDGKYKIELWGASGGYITTIGYDASYGGYTSGEIELKKGTILYFYVGQNGQDTSRTVRFNGGGYGGEWAYDFGNNMNGYAGGGATDVRIVNGSWDNFDSLKSRIMVAAGGGGSSSGPDKQYVYYDAGELSFAGGLTGYSGCTYPNFEGSRVYGTGASQTSGGSGGNNLYTSNAGYSNATGVGENGSFGKGGNARNNSSENGAGGGGGGYFGGGASGAIGSGCSGCGGGGGSSFISGHNGCNAVTEDSTEGNIRASGTSNFYDSKFVFDNTKMIDGKSFEWTSLKGKQVQMPNIDGSLNEIGKGNIGDGYAKITMIK